MLFGTVVNITKGPKQERILTTGLHTVCDIYCIECQDNVGWYYEEAYEEAQKYKEGKCILEQAAISCSTQVLPDENDEDPDV